MNNYPLTNPTYATIIESAKIAKAGLEDIIKHAADMRDAETDFTLVEKLEAVQGLISSCVELLKNWTLDKCHR